VEGGRRRRSTSSITKAARVTASKLNQSGMTAAYTFLYAV